ncbi:hypothetical protein PZA20_11980 [Pectobacterium polaris]|uniref:AbiTii domain-containing protein n=1 Tax=Pectobacterium polaris TaxID=2042057 RepID=UPI0023AF0BB0|nr:hypothetical protein [Pectobacterium polaris]MDE8742539.1 hypothetical protein [Pectobacterium polaris]
MSEPMVIRLQAMAIDNEVPIASLLRMAKAIAVKLQLRDVTAWIDNELNGYSAGSELPNYRITKGELMGHNPVKGLIPMLVSNKKDEEKLRTVHIYNAIGELADSDPESTMQFRYSTEYSHKLQQNQPEFLRFPVVIVIGQHKMINVVDQVRNRLLDWSLALEQQGIFGENLQFSQQDKDRAPMTTNNFNFNGDINNTGVIGVGNHDFTQQNTQQITAGDFGALKTNLESLGFTAEDVQELKTMLDSEPTPAESVSVLPKVYAWLGRVGDRVLDVGLDKTAPLAIEAITKYIGA